MELSSFAKAFGDHIPKYAVLIESKWTDRSGMKRMSLASGFIAAGMELASGDKHAVVVTAAHVFPDRDTDMVSIQIWRSLHSGSSVEGVSFSLPGRPTESPNVARFHQPHGDLAAIHFDAQCDPKAHFCDVESVPSVLEPGILFIPGVRVAWAGFPGFVRRTLGYPKLCYYEGVISAVIQSRTQVPQYIVDGNCAPGVSGGPMWIDAGEDGFAIIGLVSRYFRQADSATPGLCVMIPVSPLLALLGDPVKGHQMWGAEISVTPPDMAT